MEISVSRKTHFNAAHRLNVPSWSDEKNNEIFHVVKIKNQPNRNFRCAGLMNLLLNN